MTTHAVPKDESGGVVGDGVDARLRAVEERLARLETRMDYMAAKEDIQKLKIWFLGGIMGSVVAAIPIALLVAKVFSCREPAGRWPLPIQT